ncbi:hypothetical protein [Virgibacillus sp. YIM 98842]|uniref:hypothetical protein n=1 Tax=Virgibacillus sp. YIM 98842 TaxID=2663533 RepID=UPI0013DBA150|nr:hypothetical protein [Virgibacillus sp. YIM 98842]
MVDIAEKQRQRRINDRKVELINELYRLGVYETRDGRKVEDLSLFTLEHVHITEECRAAKAYGECR